MTTCIHSDIIGPHPLYPEQPKDQGTCRKCGRIRHYQVYFLDIPYKDLMRQWQANTKDRIMQDYVAEKLGREV